MLTAQQTAIEANPDHEFYNLNIDAGGMWVRRIIQRMIESETPHYRQHRRSDRRNGELT